MSHREDANPDVMAADEEKRSSFEAEAVPHLEALYRLAVRLIHDPTRAEDLVQETMLKAYRAWGQFTAGTNAKAWLLTILRNTFYSEYRRDRHPAAPVSQDVEGFTLYDKVQDADPEGSFLREIVDEEVLRAIDSLPDPYRDTLLLSDMERLSYHEIATIIDVPIGTVKSRLFRARKTLQMQLYEYAVEMGHIERSPLCQKEMIW